MTIEFMLPLGSEAAPDAGKYLKMNTFAEAASSVACYSWCIVALLGLLKTITLRGGDHTPLAFSHDLRTHGGLLRRPQVRVVVRGMFSSPQHLSFAICFRPGFLGFCSFG